MLHAVIVAPVPPPYNPAAHAEYVACVAFERLLGLGRIGDEKLWLKTFALAQETAAGLYREGITEAEWVAVTFEVLKTKRPE
jgi:hypothetical protein